MVGPSVAPGTVGHEEGTDFVLLSCQQGIDLAATGFGLQPTVGVEEGEGAGLSCPERARSILLVIIPCEVITMDSGCID